MSEKTFETRVQYLKSMVLRYVAEAAFEGTLAESILDIPKKIIPGTKPTMRCCVYKERAILAERVKLAMGGDKANPNVIEVISIACDECAKGGYQVTDNCRGCIAHRCEAACPTKSISFGDSQRARIDNKKCIQCGKCAQVCPYGAIINYRRPCENACKTGPSVPDCKTIVKSSPAPLFSPPRSATVSPADPPSGELRHFTNSDIKNPQLRTKKEPNNET